MHMRFRETASGQGLARVVGGLAVLALVVALAACDDSSSAVQQQAALPPPAVSVA